MAIATLGSARVVWIGILSNQAARSLIVSYKEDGIAIEDAESYLKVCLKSVTDLITTDVCDQQLDSTEALPETEDLIPLVNQWRDLSLPVLSLSLALLAAPLELPTVLYSRRCDRSSSNTLV